MRAADADARFAALVAEHRRENKSGKGNKTAAHSDDKKAALAFLLIYGLGVAAGAFWHGAPLVALMVGGPAVFFVRLLRKGSNGRKDAS